MARGYFNVFRDTTNPREIHFNVADGTVDPQGMNTGIQDAFNLAWKLTLVAQGHATGTRLDSYNAEREPVARNVIADVSGPAL